MNVVEVFLMEGMARPDPGQYSPAALVYLEFPNLLSAAPSLRRQ
jgi:hypothetical protein